MITNSPFKCIDLPYSEILNSFMLKAFADHNSNAAQINRIDFLLIEHRF